jgi:hypothetical protein
MTTKLKGIGVEFDDGTVQTTAFVEGNFAVGYLYEDTNGNLHVESYQGDGSDVDTNMVENNAYIFYAPIWHSVSINSSGMLILNI